MKKGSEDPHSFCFKKWDSNPHSNSVLSTTPMSGSSAVTSYVRTFSYYALAASV